MRDLIPCERRSIIARARGAVRTDIRDWALGLDGRRLAGKYRVRALIGHGGMGAVFRADDLVLERSVAVKLIHPAMRHDATRAERFLREARAAARVGAEGVVQVLDFGIDDEHGPFQILELLDGESLQDRLARGPLSVPDAVGLARALARTLARVHDAGIIHRDIKPANVFLAGSVGSDARPVLLDFGIARVLPAQSFTAPGVTIGTPGFMAPEQLRGTLVDRRADIYALGMLLHTCLLGRPPFEGMDFAEIAVATVDGALPSLRARMPHLPAALLDVIEAATAVDVAHRPSNASAFLARLDPTMAATLAVPARAAGTLAFASTEPADQSSLRAAAAIDRGPGVTERGPRAAAGRALQLGLAALVAGACVVFGGGASLVVWSRARTLSEAPMPEGSQEPSPPRDVESAPARTPAPAGGALGTPHVDVVFAGACVPRFEAPIWLTHAHVEPLGHITLTSMAGGESANVSLQLPAGPATVELSTQQAMGAGTTVALTSGGRQFSNRALVPLRAGLIGRSGPDPIGGTLTIHRFDPVSGALDVELRGVRLAAADDESALCSLEGRIWNVGGPTP